MASGSPRKVVDRAYMPVFPLEPARPGGVAERASLSSPGGRLGTVSGAARTPVVSTAPPRLLQPAPLVPAEPASDQVRESAGRVFAQARNVAAWWRSGMSLPTRERSRSLLQTARRPIVQATFSAGGRSSSKTSLTISFLPSVAAEYLSTGRDPPGWGMQGTLVSRGSLLNEGKPTFLPSISWVSRSSNRMLSGPWSRYSIDSRTFSAAASGPWVFHARVTPDMLP